MSLANQTGQETTSLPTKDTPENDQNSFSQKRKNFEGQQGQSEQNNFTNISIKTQDAFNEANLNGENTTPLQYRSPLPSVLKRLSSDKKRSSISNFVKTRVELLEHESNYYDDLKKRVRRTKIIATINQNNYKSYEQVKKLYISGVNSFLVNMAYCETNFLNDLRDWRSQLEQEFSSFVPITCVLKGSLVRIGMLSQPEIYLKKGDEFRIIIQKKVIGDSHVCSVDDDQFIKRIGIGAKIIIDYGQVGLTVLKREKSDQSLSYLQENYRYGKYFVSPASQNAKKKGQSSSSSNSSSSSSDEEQIPSEQDSQNNQSQKEQQQRGSTNLVSVISEENKKNKKVYDVIVCIVDCDCMLRSYKPIFIYKSRAETEDLFYQSNKIKKNKNALKEGEEINFFEKKNQEEEENEGEEDYDECNEQAVSAKDITVITHALDQEVDSICVSNVHTAQDILAVRKYCAKSQIKIIAKIQTLEGVQNFSDILSASDGVLIARGYLTVHIPVEKLSFKQKEMIKKANESLKPVFVSCNILDSMVSSLLPTTSEVGEISNLVSNYVDAIVLSGETSYGMYSVQAVETLSRICLETEARQVLKELREPEKYYTQFQLSKNSLGNAILRCTLDAAYSIQANLIVVFTSTGSCALKVSKLIPPCPIIAVTNSQIVARQISYLSSITAILTSQENGNQQIIEKVISFAKKQQFVRSGDYVVITSGENHYLPGPSNNMRIIQIP